MVFRRLPLLLVAAMFLALPPCAPAAAVSLPPAIGGFDYKGCLERLPNTGVLAGDGFYVNSYVANGQAANMTMGGRLDNYYCLVGDPRHYGNVRFTVNVFTFAGGVLGAQLASYDVFMQTLLPKFIVEGPSTGRVGMPFSTEAQIYSDPSSSLPWFASVVAGALPPGLRVSGNGQIVGVPRKAGVYAFTLEYTSPVVPWQDPTRPRYPVTLTIARPLAIVPDRLATATVGRRYRVPLVGRRGQAPYRFVRVRGRLPRGLTLSATGIISGTPRRGGTYKILVAITDDAGDRGRDTVLLKVRPKR
jgi:large repetitive protein